MRKGRAIPYVSHVLAVSALVMEDDGSEDEAIGALLHDGLEDAGPDYPGGPGALRREIEARFGPAVLEIVEGCTDTDELPKPPWRARKEAFIERLRNAPRPIQKVVAADKLHNARALLFDYREEGEATWARFTGTREETLWYYRTVADVLNTGKEASRLLDQLLWVVEKLEEETKR